MDGVALAKRIIQLGNFKQVTSSQGDMMPFCLMKHRFMPSAIGAT
jgi:hypothetical protein